MKTILAPVDFSHVTDQVVAQAAELASFIDARLILVHVTEPSVGVVDYAAVAMSIAQVTEAAVKNALARLQAIKEHLEVRHVTAEIKTLPGLPAEEILSEAAACAADYIVIGSHGHGAIYNLLVGSTTTAVLKGAACPVLVVPAGIVLRAANPPSGAAAPGTTVSA